MEENEISLREVARFEEYKRDKFEEEESSILLIQLSGRTSAGRVYCSTDPAECVLAPGDFPPGF